MAIWRGWPVVTLLLIFMDSSPRTAYADHERFTVGAMADAEPNATMVSSVSGKCVPSHDRVRLDCYFTSFGVWKSRPDERLSKESAELEAEIKKDPAKFVNEIKEGFCSSKGALGGSDSSQQTIPGVIIMLGTIKSFCRDPTPKNGIALLRAIAEADAKKCNIMVTDWRSTLLRNNDRWIETKGPSGLCGVVNVFTLTPHELGKLNDPVGPILWTLQQKTVTTHKTDDPVCANPTKNPLLPSLKDGTMNLRWNAPTKVLECDHFEFISGLDGMSDPRPKAK